MHTKSDARWDQARELRPFVLEMLPYKNAVTKGGEESIEKEVFDEYEDPIYIMSTRVYNSMKSYNNHYVVTPDLAYLSKPVPSLSKNNSLI
jgi:hypothetical protein